MPRDARFLSSARTSLSVMDWPSTTVAQPTHRGVFDITVGDWTDFSVLRFPAQEPPCLTDSELQQLDSEAVQDEGDGDDDEEDEDEVHCLFVLHTMSRRTASSSPSQPFILC